MCDAIGVPMSPNGFALSGCLGTLISLGTSLESTRKAPIPQDDLSDTI